MGEAMVCILGQPMTRGDPLHFVHPSHLALYQHACYEVQSTCKALSVKDLPQGSAIDLLPKQRMKSINATEGVAIWQGIFGKALY